MHILSECYSSITLLTECYNLGFHLGRNLESKEKKPPKRVKFSAKEIDYIGEGFQVHGVGNWRKILKNHDFCDSRNKSRRHGNTGLMSSGE